MCVYGGGGGCVHRVGGGGCVCTVGGGGCVCRLCEYYQ